MISLWSLSGCAKHLFPVEDNDVVPPTPSSNKCGGCNSISSIIPLCVFNCVLVFVSCHLPVFSHFINEVGFT